MRIAPLIARLLLAAAAACIGGKACAQPADPAGVDASAAPDAKAGATACDTAVGSRLFVGPGKPHATPSQAAAVARDGAVVLISAGDYAGDVAQWRQNDLTICGAGGRARLFADGRHAAGKGIWVISGSNVTVDSIEFHHARVPDQNGAGIRAEGRGLHIINSGFFDNENGILGPNAGDLTITRSEFARNGVGEHGRTHNLYVGRANRVTVLGSFFHQAVIGHNFKSRARETRIDNSYFMDGPNGTASYQIDVPNGGTVYLRGNLLHKGPKADNSVLVAYGAEGLASGGMHTLTMVHNTLASTYSGGAFLRIAPGVASVRLTANLFAGNGAVKVRGVTRTQVSETASVSCAVAGLMAPDNIAQPNFWPTTAAGGCAGPLLGMPDPTYLADAPAPLALRSISSSNVRRAGALQSAR